MIYLIVSPTGDLGLGRANQVKWSMSKIRKGRHRLEARREFSIQFLQKQKIVRESPSPIPLNLHRKDAKSRKYYSEVRFIAVVCYLFQYSREAYVTLAELLEAPSIGAFWTGLVHQKTITERSIGISRSRRRIIGCHIHKGAVAF
jgi:hypothetical protein